MGWYNRYDNYFKPYVSVAQKRANALKEVKKLEKAGRKLSPVTIDGLKIARTFWGKAWCDNLESYSDYENRLPRGRTYVRNGSVVDLQILPGKVKALVSGSSMYKIEIEIKPASPKAWEAIKTECAGQIGSLIELLQGKLSAGVMGIITRKDGGLFPKPAEIELSCSCPDYADVCKHVAAVIYGVGARLDEKPELLFQLRKVDHLDLISQAGNLPSLAGASAGTKTLADDSLADVFGIELEPVTEGAATAKPALSESLKSVAKRKGASKPVKKKPTVAKKHVPTEKSQLVKKGGLAKQSRAGRMSSPAPAPDKKPDIKLTITKPASKTKAIPATGARRPRRP